MFVSDGYLSLMWSRPCIRDEMLRCVLTKLIVWDAVCQHGGIIIPRASPGTNIYLVIAY